MLVCSNVAESSVGCYLQVFANYERVDDLDVLPLGNYEESGVLDVDQKSLVLRNFSEVVQLMLIN